MSCSGNLRKVHKATVDSVTVAELPEYSKKNLVEKEVVRHQNVFSLASNHDVHAKVLRCRYFKLDALSIAARIKTVEKNRIPRAPVQRNFAC